MGGGGAGSKKIFSAPGTSVWYKNKGSWAPLLDPPLSLLDVRKKCIDSTSVHVNSKASTLRTFLGNM